MRLKDNAVSHHFQHISCVFFGAMMLSIYVQHTLTGMKSRQWIGDGAIDGVFFIVGGISALFWGLWFLKTREKNWELFDTTYRALVLVSGVVGASLGRVYVIG